MIRDGFFSSFSFSFLVIVNLKILTKYKFSHVLKSGNQGHSNNKDKDPQKEILVVSLSRAALGCMTSCLSGMSACLACLASHIKCEYHIEL